MRRMAVLLTLFTIGCSQQSDRLELSYVENPAAETTESDISNSVDTPDFETQLHEDSLHGYSIHLPTGWGPISKDALAAQSAAVSGPQLKVEYVAGYQVVSNDLFVHPYILVCQLSEDVMPKEKLKSVRRLFQENGGDITRHAEENAGLQLNAEVGVPVLEQDTGIVWLKFQLDGPDGGRVEGLMAHYYVDGKILQFTAGTTKARSKEDWPVLESVLRTIKIHSR